METGVAVARVHCLDDGLPLLVQEVEAPALRRRWGVGATRLPGHHGHHIGVGIVANLVEALEEKPTLAVEEVNCFWKTSN